MTIQIPDVGTGYPADKTGDSPWLAMKKVQGNFADQTNAASKLVGAEEGKIPLAQDVYKAAFNKIDNQYTTSGSSDFNDYEVGSRNYANNSQSNSPPSVGGEGHWLVETISIGRSAYPRVQRATSYRKGYVWQRVGSGSSTWTEWQAVTTHQQTYDLTTASGANVSVDINGVLMRSTSSERYKDIIAPLELDDARYADAMALKPIVYRSTADADNPAYHYYSFSAEELGAYDPAFTLWRDTETVTDADGNVTEQPLAERQAEGININALLAMSHAIAIKQGELIKRLEARVKAIETK